MISTAFSTQNIIKTCFTTRARLVATNTAHCSTPKQWNRIIDATHAEIVIESSWKCLGLNFLREMWEARIMPGWIIGITPAAAGDSWLLSVDLNETDPATAPCKGLEIASWLSDHATRSTRYVIIDDEFVILEAQRKHFLMTDSYNGIVRKSSKISPFTIFLKTTTYNREKHKALILK